MNMNMLRIALTVGLGLLLAGCGVPIVPLI